MGKVSNKKDTVGGCGVGLAVAAAEWNEASGADSLGLWVGRDEQDVEHHDEA